MRDEIGKEYDGQFNDDENEKRSRRVNRPTNDPRRQSLGLGNRNVNATPMRNSATPGPVFSAADSPGFRTVPIMASFEDVMNLVKNNKITESNSWNYQLIDYFHDMSVLKEGDGINFQKASFTLDGCVKIYTSRVDSVSSETTKLLSGLSEQSGNGKKDGKNQEDENEGDIVESRQKSRKRNRGESTLAKDFSEIKAKKLELELAVDPLFRKVMADFNEGGAHSLLLNSLSIDGTGRVVFDGQSDANGDAEKESNTAMPPPDTQIPTAQETLKSQKNVIQIDLDLLRERFFPDIEELNEMSVCPSLPRLEEIVKDPSNSVSIIPDVETLQMEEADRIEQQRRMMQTSISTSISSTLPSENQQQYSHEDDDDDIVDGAAFIQQKLAATQPNNGSEHVGQENQNSGENELGGDYGGDYDNDYGGDYDGGYGSNDDDDDGDIGAFGLIDPEVDGEVTFGEPDVPTQKNINDDVDMEEPQQINEKANEVSGEKGQEAFTQIMAYFDENLKSNWAGPVHWKIQKVKNLICVDQNPQEPDAVAPKPIEEIQEEALDGIDPLQLGSEEPAPPVTTDGKKKVRRRKEIMTIDMLNDQDVMDDDIFISGESRIYIPRNQRNITTNLLPEDMHFQSDDLIHLFYKPKATLFRKNNSVTEVSVHIDSIGDKNVDAEGLPKPDDFIDENFFAGHMNENGQTDIHPSFGDDAFPAFDNDGGDDDDNDYGGDYGDDDMDENTFPDATQADPFGSNGDERLGSVGLDGTRIDLLGSVRARPEYVPYARSAKRVDLKRLKDNFWKLLDLDEASNNEEMEIETEEESLPPPEKSPSIHHEERMFSSMMKNLDTIYQGRQLQDISTSFCFISLLHLANEKGLVLESREDYTDIAIKRDLNVRKDQLSA